MSNSDDLTLGRLIADLNAWEVALKGEMRTTPEAVLAGDLPCFALGRNGNSEFIARHIPLVGFVDDYADTGTLWHGLPVIPGHALPNGAAVINAVLHRRPHQALARLGSLSSRPRVAHYSDFTRLMPESCPPLPFVAEARSVFFTHIDEFGALAARFADAESCRVLHDILLYRMTGDPVFTAGYRLRDEEQYFDVPLGLPAAPVFIDGGAYHGETTELFCRRYPGYAGAEVFEPNTGSMKEVHVRLCAYPNIRFYPYALGDRRTYLSFDDSAANASRIVEGGQQYVEVVPLDEVIEGAVNFVKFDLEGYEPKALVGARQTIRRRHPALAICVYHHPKDFIDVPRSVLEAREDYCLRLRHYTEGWEETVMYFTRT
jgi:FkbM family methyltransferase